MHYDTWKGTAAAALQRRFGIHPNSIRERVWRNAFLQGMTPAGASERAETAYLRRVSVVDRRQYFLTRARPAGQHGR